MARKLATYVTLLDENGDRHTFGPDDDVPAEFAERITNPDAWAGNAPGQSKAEPKGEAKAKSDDAAGDEDAEPKGKAPQRRSS